MFGHYPNLVQGIKERRFSVRASHPEQNQSIWPRSALEDLPIAHHKTENEKNSDGWRWHFKEKTCSKLLKILRVRVFIGWGSEDDVKFLGVNRYDVAIFNPYSRHVFESYSVVFTKLNCHAMLCRRFPIEKIRYSSFFHIRFEHFISRSDIFFHDSVQKN